MAGNWNRSYATIEPQQIHMTWLSEGEYFRVQFVTTDKVKETQLQYWPLHKKTKRNIQSITISGEEVISKDK